MVIERARDQHETILDERLLRLVDQQGRQNMDVVIERLGCGWGQAVLAIDRLSRAGVLRLVRTGRHYELRAEGST